MQPSAKKLTSVLVKPAGPDCNLACSYCFYLEKSGLFQETKVHRMSDQVLEELVKQIMTQGGPSLSFGWQGGEPTLMGLSFFEKAVSLQKQYGHRQTVGNGLQTNGILINGAWAEFLARNNFLVGLSIDGPEHIHNRYRQFPDGKGAWRHVMKSAKTLLSGGVAVNSLSVVNDYSVMYPEEIYQFLKYAGFDFMQFIPCVETDKEDPAKAAPFSVSAAAYGEFLCRLFDFWIQDFRDGKPTTSIRFFDSVFYPYAGLTPPECTLLPECGIYVVVEHNGDIYACDFFVEPEWRLGNILQDRLTDLLNSEKQTEFGRMKLKLPETCTQCRWLHYCHGGCTKDRLRDPEDRKLSHFCTSYRMFFEHADSRMRNLAASWKKEQQEQKNKETVMMKIQTGEASAGRNDPCPCGSGKKFKKCCGQ